MYIDYHFWENTQLEPITGTAYNDLASVFA